MSSILKDSRNRSPFWYASFTAADGRRLKKSTKTTDPEIAKRTAAEWESLSKAGRAGRLYESQVRKVISDLYEVATGSALASHSARSWSSCFRKPKGKSGWGITRCAVGWAGTIT